MAVTEGGLRAWWTGLNDDERAFLIRVWSGRPLPAEARVLVDRLPGMTHVHGSFGGVEFEEYIPAEVRLFLRDRRDEARQIPGK